MKDRFFFSNTKSTKLTEITPLLKEIIIPSDGSENEGFFASLPKEIFFEIVILLDAKNLALFSLTSKTLHNLIAFSPLNQHKQVYHDKNKLYKQYQTLMQQIDTENPNPFFKVLSKPVIKRSLYFTFLAVFSGSIIPGIFLLLGNNPSDIFTDSSIPVTSCILALACSTSFLCLHCCLCQEINSATETGWAVEDCTDYSVDIKNKLSKVAELEKEANAILSIIR